MKSNIPGEADYHFAGVFDPPGGRIWRGNTKPHTPNDPSEKGRRTMPSINQSESIRGVFDSIL